MANSLVSKYKPLLLSLGESSNSFGFGVLMDFSWCVEVVVDISQHKKLKKYP